MENKINVVISRSYWPLETTGCLYVFDGDRSIFNCKTIELPDKANAKSVSCILPGIYWVKKIVSPTKGECFLLLNVVGRTAVEIHVGNYAAGKKVDTEGCILPGLRFEDINHDGNIDVAESTKALGILLSILPNMFKLTIL
jgi:hypothetical protein